VKGTREREIKKSDEQNEEEVDQEETGRALPQDDELDEISDGEMERITGRVSTNS
jgi:hypothetical protein